MLNGLTWLRTEDEAPEPSEVSFDLQQLMGRTLELASRLQAVDPEQDLVLARLADALRDVGLTPPHPNLVRAALVSLDQEGWRVLAYHVELLRDDAGLAALREQVDEDVEPWLQHLADAIAAWTPLTLGLAARSAVRCEEAARRLVATLGARVAGEEHEASIARLRRLDYGRLLDGV